MRKKQKKNFVASISILCALIGIPVFFVLNIFWTNWLFAISPYIMIAIFLIAATVYTSATSKLLWDFYDARPTWMRFIPCYGELTVMDDKYRTIGTIFYLAAILFGILSQLPYNLVKVFGQSFAANFPFYMIVLALIALLGVQIVKGLGIMSSTEAVFNCWEERNHTSPGLIKLFSLLGFIPFIRVMAIYSLNKPLATMVSFMHETAYDSAEVELEEE